MAAFLGPAVTVGTTALGAVLGRPKKKKSIDLRALIEHYLGMRPGGYVTPEDQAAAERTRSRLAGAAGETARGRRMVARRSVQAKGLAGSPAELASELSIGQDEALARQGAAEQGAAQEYDAYGQNKGYLQGMIARAFGAETGAEMENARLDAARESTFWNSILDVAPTIGQYFLPKTPGVVAPTAAGQSAAPVRRPVASGYQPRTRIPTRRLGSPRVGPMVPAYP